MKQREVSILAQTTAEKFAGRGKHLDFVVGSPFNMVTDAIGTSYISDDGPDEETKISSLVSSIAGVIEKEVHWYRTAVQPRLSSFFHDLETSVSNSNIEHPLMEFDIVRLDVPDWAINGALRTEVLALKGRTYNTVTNVTLPETIGVAELRSMLLTGISAVDETINTWANALSDTRLTDAWSSYLAGPGTALAPTITGINDIDNLALAYLWVRNLADNPREDVRANLTTYSNYLAEAKIRFGANIASLLGRFTTAGNLGTVVLSSNQKTKNIYVYAPTYEAWLQTGGSSDILIGWFLSEDRFNTVTGAVLSEKGDEYQAVLNKFYSLHEVRTNANLSRSLAVHTETAFRKFLHDEPELAEDIDTGAIFDMIKHLPSTLCTIESLPRRISEISIDIIGGGVFGNTNAKEFFTKMTELEATVGTVTPDEMFALVGAKILLVHYLLANVEVR